MMFENIREIESKAERSQLKSHYLRLLQVEIFQKKNIRLINHKWFICIDIDSGDNLR
jgi:hypothetical protein